MSKRTKKITTEELQLLQESAAAYTACISAKRTRRPTTNRDKAYFAAVEAEALDAGKRGGLVAGSGYHYDRAYNGHSYTFYDEE
jgi:hypothetical protein